MFRARIFISVGCLAASFSFAQGTFQNLGFENTTILPGTPPSTVQFSAAFPGWAGFINGNPSSTALYNNINGSQPAFALIGPGSTVGNSIDGNYTAVIEAQSFSQATEVYLSQTGFIPRDSLSLQFLASFGGRAANFSVSLNGTALNLARLQDIGTSAPFYSLYAADVSSFAGQVAELRIINSAPAGGEGFLWVDSLAFSSSAVPEPSTWALLALGSALFCFTRRKQTSN